MTPWINAAATFYMAGVVWFVQLVHYPLLRYVPAEAFREYHRRHLRATTVVVAGPMIVELLTAIALLWAPSPFSPTEVWVGLMLLLGIWGSTFFLQMAQHTQLERSFDIAVVDALVQGNWVRTALWTVRSLLWIVALVRPGMTPGDPF